MKDEPNIPKTKEEMAEAYKLLDDFRKALARQQAFREVVGKYISEHVPSQEEKEK
jgi:hypothetical protein